MDEEQSGGGVRRGGSVKKRGGGWEKTQPHSWLLGSPMAGLVWLRLLRLLNAPSKRSFLLGNSKASLSLVANPAIKFIFQI